MKLARTNAHKRDIRIEFFPENHQYVIDKIHTDYMSVTTFIKKFFVPFDSDAFIQSLVDKHIFYKKYPNKTPSSLKEEWIKIGQESAMLGTKLHEAIEYFYNDEVKSTDEIITKEWCFFKNFLQEHPQLKPFRTEWYIFSERFKIAWSIDMIFKDDSDKYHIYDWKRSKNIKYKNPYQKGKYPLEHVQDCNYYHYSLQLNMYKYILKHCYRIEIETMFLVILHPNNDTYKLIKIADMQFEIKQMLKQRFECIDKE